MTNSNIITRTCAALIIVLSILLAGGAPSLPGTHSASSEAVETCLACE